MRKEKAKDEERMNKKRRKRRRVGKNIGSGTTVP
jgi:hypothetical protein